MDGSKIVKKRFDGFTIRLSILRSILYWDLITDRKGQWLLKRYSRTFSKEETAILSVNQKSFTCSNAEQKWKTKEKLLRGSDSLTATDHGFQSWCLYSSSSESVSGKGYESWVSLSFDFCFCFDLETLSHWKRFSKVKRRNRNKKSKSINEWHTRSLTRKSSG